MSLSREEMWFYKLHDATEHGPHTSEEMLQWFRMGYFDMSLLVRKAVDPEDEYKALQELVHTNNNQVPFVCGKAAPQMMPPGAWYHPGMQTTAIPITSLPLEMQHRLSVQQQQQQMMMLPNGQYVYAPHNGDVRGQSGQIMSPPQLAQTNSGRDSADIRSTPSVSPPPPVYQNGVGVAGPNQHAAHVPLGGMAHLSLNSNHANMASSTTNGLVQHNYNSDESHTPNEDQGGSPPDTNTYHLVSQAPSVYGYGAPAQPLLNGGYPANAPNMNYSINANKVPRGQGRKIQKTVLLNGGFAPPATLSTCTQCAPETAVREQQTSPEPPAEPVPMHDACTDCAHLLHTQVAHSQTDIACMRHQAQQTDNVQISMREIKKLLTPIFERNGIHLVD